GVDRAGGVRRPIPWHAVEEGLAASTALVAGALQAFDGVDCVGISGDEPMIRSPPMLVVGLTGGIGAGKSAVSRLLAERGAVVLDADVVAREVGEPGGPPSDPLGDRLGNGALPAAGRVVQPA